MGISIEMNKNIKSINIKDLEIRNIYSTWTLDWDLAFQFPPSLYVIALTRLLSSDKLQF